MQVDAKQEKALREKIKKLSEEDSKPELRPVVKESLRNEAGNPENHYGQQVKYNKSAFLFIGFFIIAIIMALLLW